MARTEPRGGPVRALVVDDSALMRKLLSEILRSTGEIEIAGTARDGEEAIELVTRLRPDVVTLDVQMPGRSGLEILPDLLAAHAVPVVMVSSLTQEGADVTLAALELGAVDYIPKPERFQFAEMRQAGQQMVAKVLAAAHSRVRRPRAHRPIDGHLRRPVATSPGPSGVAVVIGISTGGPQTLSEFLPPLEPPCPPILIVQHMPARFTSVFAERLNRYCSLEVREAADGDRIRANQILIAPGGRHMSVAGSPLQARVVLSDDPPVSGHRPSVDVLFRSAAGVFRSGTVGLLMTGMGRDGVDGCKAILEAGGDTYGQDEATSVVYGMNKAAFLEGAVRAQFTPDELPALLKPLHGR